MAVDKFSGVPDMAGITVTPLLEGRTSLEDTLARFDEQVAQYEPRELRKKLKKRLGNLRVNIDGALEGQV